METPLLFSLLDAPEFPIAGWNIRSTEKSKNGNLEKFWKSSGIWKIRKSGKVGNLEISKSSGKVLESGKSGKVENLEKVEKVEIWEKSGI